MGNLTTMYRRPTALRWAFHLGFPQYTRGTGAFCVCQGVVDAVSTVASSTLFCPLFSEKKHQLLRRGTRTSPCVTRTYTCVDFSSSPDYLEVQYVAVRTNCSLSGSRRCGSERQRQAELGHQRSRGECPQTWKPVARPPVCLGPAVIS